MTTPNVSHEVQGREDLTLLQAIDQHLVPTPELLGWDEWRNWRREHGQRPKSRSQKLESELWQSTMTALYGPEFLKLIHARDLAIEADEPVTPAPMIRPRPPSPRPDEGPPGAGTGPPLEPATPAPQPSSPRAERAAPEEQARLPRQGAGSHRSSDEPHSCAPSTS